ncbi:DUF3310 domain-containing protein [Staphylococcus caledonicus]|uniref:DUF3310 domain-containing protein n=1 Tax=Staphylococcus sp. acrmy TaxID=2929076 RepID=UPI001F59E24E|nr:DUF3310 domain-containing protein [Staphylococcus sp. acrmy]MCI2948357.1 DUF3310 domain-containing protein [Staphylococcus sp. acrmy]
MRISDLNRNDVIRLYSHDKSRSILAIVDEPGGTNQKNGIYFWAKVEIKGGRKDVIDDSWEFMKVNEPFTRKVDMVKEPNHYTSNEGIDLIEFCKQQFTEEEFRGAMKFTQLRYALRTGRKKNDLQDQQKLKEYANRFIEVLEG